MNNELTKIKEEYHNISNELKDLQKERDFYLSDNELLISKNCELNNEYNSLLSKIEAQNEMLELTENKLNKKRELLETRENSNEYVTLRNQIEEQVNEFLNQKKEFFKLAIITILNIMKQDPEKQTLINNILNPNEKLNFGLYRISYEEKIADIALDILHNVALEINTNNILNS